MEKNNLEELSVGEIMDQVLDEVDREILELRYFSHYTIKDVANEMRLSPGEVRENINNALIKLRPIIPLVSDEIPEDSDYILPEEETIIAEAFNEELSSRFGRASEYSELEEE